jgi:uncharacterized membrane protein YgdD (TMEM256/DUF423 family)
MAGRHYRIAAMAILTAGRLLRLGAILAGVGVALGAFGAHGLRPLVTPERLAVFETGVRYHLVHALAVLAAAGVAHVAPHAAAPRWAGALFALGVVLFSGSLYLLVGTGVTTWGAVTPLGGVAFIAGWIALASTPIDRAWRIDRA